MKNKYKVIGIVSEYNPFHTGHKHQIETIKKEYDNPYIISFMSGEFVQRGAAAIVDKYARATMAVKNGADLCIQLPTFFSTQVAEIFAKGAINTLNSLGIVDAIHFGSETGDITLLESQSKKIENSYPSIYSDTILDEKNLPLNTLIKNNNKSGKSFIKIFSENNGNLPDMSNDILAIEYIKALKYFNSNIVPLTMKRHVSSHNEVSINKEFASSTAIRNSIHEGMLTDKSPKNIFKFLPENSLIDFKEKKYIFDEHFFEMIKFQIISNKENLKNIFEISEGLENRILKFVDTAKTYEDLIFSIKSKRYTLARIRRIMFNTLLDIQKSQIDTIKASGYKIPYIKILAFNDRGRYIIKKIKQKNNVEIINKFANYKPYDEYSTLFYEKDLLANRIYNIPITKYKSLDYFTSPSYIK